MRREDSALGFAAMYRVSRFGGGGIRAAESRRFAATGRATQRAQEAALQYNAERLSTRFRGQRAGVMRRRMQIAMPLTAFMSRVLVDVQMGREQERRAQRASEFMRLIASLGPAFIKAGQALSTRPDLLPQEYLNELEKLQDRLPPFPKDLAIRQVEEALETKVESVFSHFDPTPVAAASIGQVYKAKLRSGEDVAVKVQRPGCEDIVSLDLYILRELSGFLNRMLEMIGRETDLRSVIDEFGSLIFSEMDYIEEATNADRFKELYGNIENIHVPKVHWKYTRRKVLILDWVDGVRLTAVRDEKDKPRLVKLLLHCSLQQMLANGFFHADPHGGNLLATPDGKLCFLDFGMMSTIKPHQRYAIIQAVVHLVNRDWQSIVNLYVKLGFIPVGTDTKAIVQALEERMPNALNSSVADFNFSSVMKQMGNIMYTYPFQLPKYYTAIIRCMAVLEGVALRVAPEVKIVNEAYPFIAARLLTEPAEELRETLMLLLFDNGHLRMQRLETLLLSASEYSDYNFATFVNSFIDYIYEDDRESLRENIAEDLASEIDELSFDAGSYVAGSVAQLGVMKCFPLSAKMPEPIVTDRMKKSEQLAANLLKRDDVFDRQTLSQLGQRVLGDGRGRRMGFVLMAKLLERAVVRSLDVAVKSTRPTASRAPSSA